MPPIFPCASSSTFFVEGGHRHILQHLDIARHFRVDLHRQYTFVPVHFYGHHAAAR
jgi:hypothetical protein